MAASSLVPLVVRFGRLGDMVLQTPLFHVLHRRFGHPCRVLTSGPWSSPLFAGSPDVELVWELRARHAPFLLSPERWSLLQRLRKHVGPIYVSEDSRRQLPKIRRLFAMSGVREERCVFLDRLPALVNEHWVDHLLRLGQATPADFPCGPAAPGDLWEAPRLFLRPADRDDRMAWLQRRGLAGVPLIVLQPGNKRAIKWGRARHEDPKAWPVRHWAALVRAMRQHMPAAHVLLCGSPAEHSYLEDIRRLVGLDRVSLGTRDLPLRRLLAVLETAHSMVSVDTGPAHMAAAVGCPLVVLYGSESPARWSRRSPSHSRVIELGGPPVSQAASDIPLERVVDAWLDLCAHAAVP